MDILLLEPYLTGSHKQWAEGYARHSTHQVTILSLPGRFWKWRMHGGAVTLAEKFAALPTLPDLILATDMLNLATFQALTRQQTHTIPCALYFHENQLTYPWSPRDRDVKKKRNEHYSFINYASAMAADALFFNSAYHLVAFLAELPVFLNQFPDFKNMKSVGALEAKAQVLPLGLDLQRLDPWRSTSLEREGRPPLILWNHRWEYDKNPTDFFKALHTLAEENLAFEVVILGENFRQSPVEFSDAKGWLGERLLHIGYAQDFAEYARWLWQADILPVTSHHDFFGASVVQAIYCGCYPLLPKQLVYPDLIPASLHGKYLYENQADLISKLRHLLSQARFRRPSGLAELVEQFDWSNSTPLYDNVLSKVKI